MKTKIFSTTLAALLLTIICTTVQAQVPADDFHAMSVAAANIKNETEEVQNTKESLAKRIRKLADLGALLDKLLSIDFLFPQMDALVSKTAVESVVPSSSGSGSIAGNVTGESNNQTFPDKNTVSASIQKKFQIQEEGAEEKCGGKNSKLKSTVESMVSSATGGLIVKKGKKSTEVQKKRKQANISKQMFAHYSLATGLVHRTLAHRTINDNRKKTQEIIDSAQTIRKAHSVKTHAVANMGETYNRLLFSQAISNAMSSFKAIDQIEGKITIGIPLPDADMLGDFGMGSLLGF